MGLHAPGGPWGGMSLAQGSSDIAALPLLHPQAQMSIMSSTHLLVSPFCYGKRTCSGCLQHPAQQLVSLSPAQKDEI